MSTTSQAHSTRPAGTRQARETRDAQRYLHALFDRDSAGVLIEVRYRYRTGMRQRFLPARDLYTAAARSCASPSAPTCTSASRHANTPPATRPPSRGSGRCGPIWMTEHAPGARQAPGGARDRDRVRKPRTPARLLAAHQPRQVSEAEQATPPRSPRSWVSIRARSRTLPPCFERSAPTTTRPARRQRSCLCITARRRAACRPWPWGSPKIPRRPRPRPRRRPASRGRVAVRVRCASWTAPCTSAS